MKKETILAFAFILILVVPSVTAFSLGDFWENILEFFSAKEPDLSPKIQQASPTKISEDGLSKAIDETPDLSRKQKRELEEVLDSVSSGSMQQRSSAGTFDCYCGDIDGSGGKVDLDDFSVFAICFNLLGPAGDCSTQDFYCSNLDGSGKVDLNDFSIFALRYGHSACGYPPNCNGAPGQENCGDGVIFGCEECDDGNMIDGDGCSSDCLLEILQCGDNICNLGENCSLDNSDCSSPPTCQQLPGYCTDGCVYTFLANWEEDPGRCDSNGTGCDSNSCVCDGLGNCIAESTSESGKNQNLYSERETFLISDNNWKDILPLVPLTTWTGNETWCQNGTGTSENVCVYPTLIFHEEQNLIYSLPQGTIGGRGSGTGYGYTYSINGKSLVRIYLDGPKKFFFNLDLDIASVGENYADVVLTDREKDALEELGYNLETLPIYAPLEGGYELEAGYHTYDEMVAELNT